MKLGENFRKYTLFCWDPKRCVVDQPIRISNLILFTFVGLHPLFYLTQISETVILIKVKSVEKECVYTSSLILR